MSETDGLAYTAALMMKVVEDDGMLSSYTFEHVVNVLVVNRFMSQKPKEGSLGSAWYEKQFRKLPQGWKHVLQRGRASRLHVRLLPIQ